MKPEENPQQKRLEFASDLARKVGREALRFWQEKGSANLGVENKGLQDFVTVADKAAEDTIRRALMKTFPDDGFLGEETGGKAGTGGTWIVDPIDGTANYLRGLRHWGVSIAYVEDGVTVIGVIHDSPNDRIFAASLNGGATVDGVALKVAPTAKPEMATGILGASRRTPIDPFLAQIRALHSAGFEYRKIGAAAIGIIRVAEGVADFYYEDPLNCWDALAALLIASEAGARVITPPMDQFIAKGGEVFCATPALADQLESILVGTSGFSESSS